MKIQTLILISLSFFFFGSNILISESTFTGNDIEEATIEYIKSVVKDEIEIEILTNLHDKIFKPSGVTASFVTNGNKLRGNTAVYLEFFYNGKQIEKISIPLKIKIYSEVPVAIENISSGQNLSNSYEIRREDVSDYDVEKIASPNELKKAISKRHISKGRVITEDLISKNNLIRRGDEVDIIVVAGSVYVVSSGMAITDASEGEKVRVKKNGQKNQILTGWTGSDGKVYIKAR